MSLEQYIVIGQGLESPIEETNPTGALFCSPTGGGPSNSASPNINSTIIVEPYTNPPELSACTGIFTNEILSCSGDSQIELSTGNIIINSSLIVTGNTLLQSISATTISANTIDSLIISANTYQNLPTAIIITGGSYSDGIEILTNNSGGTVTITGWTNTETILHNGLNTYTAGTTFAPSVNISAATLSSLSVSGNSVLNTLTVTGNSTLQNISASTISASTVDSLTISATTYQNLPVAIIITGGTYSAGIETLTNNSGGTVTITGFTSTETILQSGFNTYTGGTTFAPSVNISAATLASLSVTGSSTLNTLSVTGNTSLQNISASNISGVTSLTAGTISATTYQNLPFPQTIVQNGTNTFTGGTISAPSVNITAATLSSLNVTGSSVLNNLTVSGITTLQNVSVSVISANTISATTYQNLPPSTILQSGLNTYTGGTTAAPSINISAATLASLSVTGSGLFNTISATTYQNLPKDIYVTGGTYSNGTAIFTNDSGGTFTVTGFSTGYTNTNIITGISYNNTTGITTLTNNTGGTLTATGYYTGYTPLTYVYLTGGSFSANVITLTNNTGGTQTLLINNFTGLTVNGTISATTISGTTFYGDGSHLSGISTANYYTTGATLIGKTEYFNRNDSLSAYTANLTSLAYQSDLNSHTGNTTNPHLTTASQVGAYTSGYTDSNFVHSSGDTITGNLTINGDLFVNGPTFSSHTENVYVSANTIDINYGEVGSGVTKGYAGIVIDRGTATDYEFIFDESTKEFRVGTSGNTEAVATRENNPINMGIPYWNPSGNIFNTSSNLLWNNGSNELSVAGTISATTYYNLPKDIYITGGSYSNGTAIFTNDTGGTFTVVGFSTGYTNTNIITGISYNNTTGITTITNNTGGTLTASGYYTGYTTPTAIIITGGTYSAGTETLTNNTGGTVTITGFSTSTATAFTGGTVTGATNFSAGLTANTISAITITATTFYGDGSHLSDVSSANYYTTGATLIGSTEYFNRNDSLSAYSVNLSSLITTTLPWSAITSTPSNIIITGGTYSAGTEILTNNTGGTVTITGFSTGYTNNNIITGGTFNYNGQTLSLINNTGGTITITGFTDVYVTGGTYNNTTGIATFTNITGGTFTVTGFDTIGQFTGGSVTGATNFTGGLSANSISATTYYNLPVSTILQSGLNTYTGGTTSAPSVNISAATLSSLIVTGNTSLQALTATTISATTYYNIPSSNITYYSRFIYMGG